MGSLAIMQLAETREKSSGRLWTPGCNVGESNRAGIKSRLFTVDGDFSRMIRHVSRLRNDAMRLGASRYIIFGIAENGNLKSRTGDRFAGDSVIDEAPLML